VEPFAPTDAPPPGLQAAEIVTDTLRAMGRNVGSLAVFTGIELVLYVLSIATCAGWIVLIPLMAWGGLRFLLKVADGQSDLSVMWKDLPWGPMVGRMWGALVVWGVLLVPVLLLGVVGQALSGMTAQAAWTVAVAVLSALYNIVLVRVYFGPFLMVDRGLGVLAGFSESIRITGPEWRSLAILQLLVALIGAPAQVIAFGLQVFAERAQGNPQLAVQQLPTLLGLYGVLLVYGIGMGLFTYLAYAVTYRRLTAAQAA
jgi:hypothetical protein